MKKSDLTKFCIEAGINITLKGNQERMLQQIHSTINNQVGYALISGNKEAEMYWKEIRTVFESFLKRG
ncbi:MAG: hypothetical protein FJ264_17020 [Planctomycetes bacterium]|nr:hypothetical protein [Planctomycetota bacterium]